MVFSQWLTYCDSWSFIQIISSLNITNIHFYFFFDYTFRDVYEYRDIRRVILLFMSRLVYIALSITCSFVCWFNLITSHGSLNDKTNWITTITVDLFSFFFRLFFKFVRRLGRSDMFFFELVICRDIMFLLLIYIYMYDASCRRHKVLGCVCICIAVMYRVINTKQSQFGPVVWWAHAHTRIRIYIYSFCMRALSGSTIFFNLRPSSFFMRWTGKSSAYHFISCHHVESATRCLFVYIQTILLYLSCLIDVNDRHNRNDD